MDLLPVPPLLTLDQAAERLGTSPSSIRRMVAEGMPAGRLGHRRQLLFDRWTLDFWAGRGWVRGASRYGRRRGGQLTFGSDTRMIT